jgi:hypothetical protein
MGKSDKFLVIVERKNEPLLDALNTAYEAPKYEVVADRRSGRQSQRRVAQCDLHGHRCVFGV